MHVNHETLQKKIDALQKRVVQLQTELSQTQRPARTGLGTIVGIVACALLAGLFLVQQPGSAFQKQGEESQSRADRPTNSAGANNAGQPKGTGNSTAGGPTTDGQFRSVKVVNDKGQPVVVFDVDSRGGKIEILSPAGVPLLSMHVDDDGGVVRINDKNGSARVMHWVSQGGNQGLVTLLNKQGKVIAALSGDDNGGIIRLNNAQGDMRGLFAIETGKDSAFVSLHGPLGKQQAILGSEKNGTGGMLRINAKNGDPRIVLDTHKTGGGLDVYSNDRTKGGAYFGVESEGKSGLLLLYGNNGKEIIRLSEHDGGGGPGGALVLAGDNGKRRVTLGSDKDGGLVGVHGPDGSGLGYLWIDPDGRGGFLQLNASSNGKARVIAGVGKNGTGYVEGRDTQDRVSGTLRYQ